MKTIMTKIFYGEEADFLASGHVTSTCQRIDRERSAVKVTFEVES